MWAYCTTVRILYEHVCMYMSNCRNCAVAVCVPGLKLRYLHLRMCTNVINANNGLVKCQY